MHLCVYEFFFHNTIYDISMFIDILTAILQLIAGVGVFLLGCEMMSNNLESASGDYLKNLFSKMGRSKILGVGIGAGTTALIQSSSATTVMVIGFVNVGIMSLTQAATIIYGANIGTTITAQIVALGLSSGGGISVTTLLAALAGVGAFVTFSTKSDMGKKVGGILLGFGMLFVGLQLMSNSMKEFAEEESIRLFLTTIGHPLLLVLLGAIFTAIMQSSSAMTSIVITMVAAGLLKLDQGIYLSMGANVGTCVTALIASVASTINAKRASLIHLFFNCFGVLLFLTIAWVMYLSTSGAWSFGRIFEHLIPGEGLVPLQLAMFHTIFNCTTVIVVLPLTKYLVDLVTRILPQKAVSDKEDPNQPHFHFVDDKMLRTPIIAVNQVKLEIENMAAVSIHNFQLAIDIITNVNFDKMNDFEANENQLNYLNHNLIPYIVQLNNLPLNEEDHRYLATAIRTIGDLERVGDYAVNITEYAEVLKNSKEKFSSDILFEINQMRDIVVSLYQSSMKAYMDQDLKALDEANTYEDEVDAATSTMEKMHLQRLTDGIYSANVGAIYQELASDSERIADHFLNVAKSIRQLHVGED